MIEELMDFELFQGLKASSYQMLKQFGRIESYNQGYLLIKERYETNDLYFIVDGIVSIYKINVNGQKKIIYMLNKGCFLNEDLDRRPSSVSAMTYVATKVFVIKKDLALKIMADDFVFCQKILYSLSSKMRRLYRQLKNSPNSIRIEKKVAAKLYKLAKDYGSYKDGGIEIEMTMSITFLADLLGAPRETVSRAISKLSKLHLICYHNKRFYIYNLKDLAHYFKS